MHNCAVRELGRIEYGKAFELQQRLVEQRKQGLIADQLLLLEHPHTITLGRNGRLENLLASEPALRSAGISFHASDRGGDITYHGPGQVVGYPILDLREWKRDVGAYVRAIEQVMIDTLADFGIAAGRVAGCSGAWVDGKKIGAIGVHISRWVTSHGFAYNVATDLRYFDLIVPCGIAERKATSLEKLLGRCVSLNEVKPRLAAHFGEVFGLEVRPADRSELLERLEEAERAVAVPA